MMRPLGLGIGWRPEWALAIERRTDLGFVELLAEDIPEGERIPDAVEALIERGVAVIPHGVSLSLGGADVPDPRRLRRLADLARQVDAPLVSEHVAFVRGGGVESGHLLPVQRTEAMLEIVAENVRIAQAALPVPLALENIASLFQWPEDEMDEAEFLSRLVERTGALFLLDISNLYANGRNQGFDPAALLDRLPLDRLAYVHIGGGVEQNGVYHDTHTDPVPPGALSLAAALAAQTEIPGVMLERDDHFGAAEAMNSELDAIAAAVRRGREVEA